MSSSRLESSVRRSFSDSVANFKDASQFSRQKPKFSKFARQVSAAKRCTPEKEKLQPASSRMLHLQFSPLPNCKDRSKNWETFPPYDAIWEKIFSLYGVQQQPIKFEEMGHLFNELLTPNMDGLSCTLAQAPPTPICLPCFKPLVKSDSAFTLSMSTDDNLVIGPFLAPPNAPRPFSKEAAELFQLFQGSNLFVSEDEIATCLLKTLTKNSAPSHKAKEDVTSELGASAMLLKEASTILEGKISNEALEGALSYLVSKSKPIDGSLCGGGAKEFARKVNAALRSLLLTQLQKLKHSQRECGAEEISLLHLLEKVVYLGLKTGCHMDLKSRKVIHLYTKKVWAHINSARLEGMFTKHYPFSMYKQIIWDILDGHHFFDLRKLSSLFRQFKKSLFVVLSVSQHPIYEALQVVAMVNFWNNHGYPAHDEFEFIKNMCLEMLLLGMKSEPMDDPECANIMLEFDPGLDDSALFLTLDSGILALAVKHEVGEFLCLHRVKEILRCVWYGELHNTLDKRQQKRSAFHPSEIWSDDCLIFSKLHLQLYRKCPFIMAFLDACIWMAFLCCIYLTIIIETALSNGFDSTFSSFNYVMFGITAGFLLNETKQLLEDGVFDHFSSYWNLQDGLIIFTVVAFAICKGNVNISNEVAYQALSVVSLFVLFRIMYFATIFESYGMLVFSLFTMIADVGKFILLYALIIWGFAVVLYVLASDAEKFQSIPVAIMFLFEAGMQQFDFGWLSGCKNQTLGIVFLALFVLVAAVILLNMLIAFLSETYSRMSNESIQHSAVGRANFIIEYATGEHLPVPLNIISMMTSLGATLLKGRKKTLWTKSTGVLVGIVDYVITMFLIAPVACVSDIAYISQVFIVSCVKEEKATLTNSRSKASTSSKPARPCGFSYICGRVLLDSIYQLLHLAAYLTAFIVSYFGRIHWKLFCSAPQSSPDKYQCNKDILKRRSFQELQRQKDLTQVKIAMLTRFRNQEESSEYLLHEVNANIADLSEKITQTELQNAERIDKLEQRLLKKLNADTQTSERIDDLEKRLFAKLNEMDQVNNKLIQLLESNSLTSSFRASFPRSQI